MPDHNHSDRADNIALAFAVIAIAAFLWLGWL